MKRLTGALGLGFALSGLPSVANAATASEPTAWVPDDAPGDGIYGRFRGDFSLALGGSAEIDITRQTARPLLFTTLRFYQAVGITLTGSQSVKSSDPLERRFTASVILEPLFLLRWPKYQHSGRALADLTLDSLQIHAGAAFLEPRGGNFASPTVANVGAGFGVPLQGRANGLWLRSRLDVELGGDSPAVLALVGLEWQFFFESAWLH